MEAVVVGDDVEAQFLIEFSVCEHGDVVACPAVTEDDHTPAAVGEGYVIVCTDDAAVELVAEFGFVSEFLDSVAVQGRKRVEVAVLQDVLAGGVVSVHLRVYYDFSEHVGYEVRGYAEKQQDCCYDYCDYHGKLLYKCACAGVVPANILLHISFLLLSNV